MVFFHFVRNSFKQQKQNNDYSNEMCPDIDSLVMQQEHRPENTSEAMIVEPISRADVRVPLMQLMRLIKPPDIAFCRFGIRFAGLACLRVLELPVLWILLIHMLTNLIIIDINIRSRINKTTALRFLRMFSPQNRLPFPQFCQNCIKSGILLEECVFGEDRMR